MRFKYISDTPVSTTKVKWKEDGNLVSPLHRHPHNFSERGLDSIVLCHRVTRRGRRELFCVLCTIVAAQLDIRTIYIQYLFSHLSPFRYRLLPSQTKLREALSQAGQERRTVSLIVRFEMVVVVDYYCETRRGQGSDDVGDFILRYSRYGSGRLHTRLPGVPIGTQTEHYPLKG